MRVVFLLIAIWITFPVLASAPLDTGLYDDAYIVLDYSGGWTQQAITGAFGGNVQQTTSQSDSVSFQLYSNAFTIFFMYGVGNDSVEVCIDETCTTVATNGAVASGMASFTALGAGLKDVTISKATDDASALDFDALYIHPYESEVVTNETILSNSYSYNGESYTGSIAMSMDAGQVSMIRMLVFIATISTIQLVVSMFKR